MTVSVRSHAPSALFQERTPLSIELAADWTPLSVWTSLEMKEALVSTGIRTQVHASSRQSVYRLRHPDVFVDKEINKFQARNVCLICMLLKYLKSYTYLLGLSPVLHGVTVSLLASLCNISKFSFTWSLD